MPVDFLTPEQEEKYGCFCDTPTSEQLAKYFWLPRHIEVLCTDGTSQV